MDKCFKIVEEIDKKLAKKLRKEYGDDIVNNPMTLLDVIENGLSDEMLSLRQAKIQAMKQKQILDFLETHPEGVDKAFMDIVSGFGARKNFGHYSLERKYETVLGQAHAEMAELMEKYRPRWFGFSRSKKAQRNLVREVFEEGSSGDTDAVEFARAWKQVTEKLRQRFNRAGGGIQKLFDWNLPMRHDAAKMRRAGKTADEAFATWFEFVRDKIDRRRIAAYQMEGSDVIKHVDMTDEQFKKLMRNVFDNLSSEGAVKLDPQKFNPRLRRAMGNRHQEHRLLTFKSADNWLEYADKYGGPDYFNSMMDYVDMMSKEIAAMEMFGPNPDHTIDAITALAQQTMKKRSAGAKAKNVYETLMGRQYAQNVTFADTMATLRNLEVASKIGGSLLTALSDLSFITMTAAYNDVPIFKTLLHFMGGFNPLKNKADRVTLTRLGLMADYAIDRARSANRISDVVGYGYSARAADAVVRMGGLNYWTNTAKQTFQMEYLANLAELSKKYSWEKLITKKRGLAKAFKRVGFNKADWEMMRVSRTLKKRGVEFINPTEIAKTNDDLATRIVALIKEETNFAIPEPNAKTRALMKGGTKAGTFWGEVARSVGQFKSFAVSILCTHLARAANETGIGRMKYMAGLLAGATILGGVSYQAKELIKGRNLIDPKDQKQWAKFIMAAISQGGGLGVISDFLFLDTDNYGGAISTAIGPLASDFDKLVLNYGLGSAQDVAKGERDLMSKLAIGGVKAAETFTPKLWYTRVLQDRLVFDYLNHLADPKWAQRQNRIYRRMMGESNQDYWWRPGASNRYDRHIKKALDRPKTPKVVKKVEKAAGKITF